MNHLSAYSALKKAGEPEKCYNRPMITILAILITWYITKYYYTRSFTLDIEESDLIKATCSKCARSGYISQDNLRAPYYCVSCK